jgi:hypothetical protein
MAPRDFERRVTEPTTRVVPGNPLFARAAIALGLDEEVGRDVLSDVLLARGVSPTSVTAAEIGAALPDLEKRLRLFVNDAFMAALLARVRSTISE